MNGRRLNARVCNKISRHFVFAGHNLSRARGGRDIIFRMLCVLRESAPARENVSVVRWMQRWRWLSGSIAARAGRRRCPGARAPPAPGPPIRLSAAAQTAESEPERRCAKTQRSRLARALPPGCWVQHSLCAAAAAKRRKPGLINDC